jgi:hypothetical protein
MFIYNYGLKSSIKSKNFRLELSDVFLKTTTLYPGGYNLTAHIHPNGEDTNCPKKNFSENLFDRKLVSAKWRFIRSTPGPAVQRWTLPAELDCRKRKLAPSSRPRWPELRPSSKAVRQTTRSAADHLKKYLLQRLSQRPDVVIFKYFRQKIRRKNWRFRLKTKLNYAKCWS